MTMKGIEDDQFKCRQSRHLELGERKNNPIFTLDVASVMLCGSTKPLYFPVLFVVNMYFGWDQATEFLSQYLKVQSLIPHLLKLSICCYSKNKASKCVN